MKHGVNIHELFRHAHKSWLSYSVMFIILCIIGSVHAHTCTHRDTDTQTHTHVILHSSESDPQSNVFLSEQVHEDL